MPPAPARRWLRPLLLTLAFAALVAGAIADGAAWVPPLWAIGAAAVLLGLLHQMVPRGMHFAIGTTAGLGIYMALYVVIGRAAFPQAEGWPLAIAFLTPVGTFLAAATLRRGELRRIAAQEWADQRQLRGMGRWLVPCFAIAILCLATPVSRLPGDVQGVALLGAMLVIGVIVAASVEGVLGLLLDAARILEDLGNRLAALAVPMVTFTMVYALLVVAFAAVFRIADGLSHVPLFHALGTPHRLAFPDALYFSLVTQATVGYGDLTPHDDGVRLLAAVQVVMGQLLLLFGVAELMRGRGGSKAGRLDAADPPAHPRRNRPPD